MHHTAQHIWGAFSAMRKEGKARHRDIADKLGMSEGELVAAHVQAPVRDGLATMTATRLTTQWPDMFEAFEALGAVMALTRNASCVHEKIGVYRQASGSGDVGRVLGDDIDLRLAYAHWAHGFAVVERVGDGEQRSLQFFDKAGVAVHKVHLKESSDVQAFEALTTRFASGDQAPGMIAIASQVGLPEQTDDAVDVMGLRRAWDSLRDTHDFAGMLKTHGVTHMQALRLADPKYVLAVDPADCQSLLRAAAAEGVPIMVCVGNEGVVQIHTGPIRKVVVMGPWLNVLDPGFNLHLREDQIASTWVVRMPTLDGLVTSLALFDGQGHVIATLSGARKPGQRETCEWRHLIQDIQQEPRPCLV